MVIIALRAVGIVAKVQLCCHPIIVAVLNSASGFLLCTWVVELLLFSFLSFLFFSFVFCLKKKAKIKQFKAAV